jgi:DNA-binding PadR family transcriptional regulator
MNDKLAELIKKNGKLLGALKDEKTLESILAINEIFLDKFLERGDIRLLILDSILEKPKHGYQIMTLISKKFHEVYKPSPGVIYPTLQSLNEEELIKSDDGTKKKVYTITKKGEKCLKQNKKQLESILGEFETAYSGGNKEFGESRDNLMTTWIELACAVFLTPKNNWSAVKDPRGKMDKVNKILKKTTLEINEIW